MIFACTPSPTKSIIKTCVLCTCKIITLNRNGGRWSISKMCRSSRWSSWRYSWWSNIILDNRLLDNFYTSILVNEIIYVVPCLFILKLLIRNPCLKQNNYMMNTKKNISRTNKQWRVQTNTRADLVAQ